MLRRAGLLALAFAWTAEASSNLCVYNGKELTFGMSSEHFTGEYTCKDSETNKTVLAQNWVDGQPDGPYAKYDFQTGKMEERGTYRRGKLNGVQRRYQKGVLQFEWAYAEDKTVGVQKEFTDGALTRVYVVDANGTMSAEISLNKKGQPMNLHCGAAPIGKDDRAWCGLDGTQSTVTLYDEAGHVTATEQYRWGKLDGVSKRFNVTTGQPYEEERYSKGELELKPDKGPSKL